LLRKEVPRHAQGFPKDSRGIPRDPLEIPNGLLENSKEFLRFPKELLRKSKGFAFDSWESSRASQAFWWNYQSILNGFLSFAQGHPCDPEGNPCVQVHTYTYRYCVGDVWNTINRVGYT
jgi:hypothetical protein